MHLADAGIHSCPCAYVRKRPRWSLLQGLFSVPSPTRPSHNKGYLELPTIAQLKLCMILVEHGTPSTSAAPALLRLPLPVLSVTVSHTPLSVLCVCGCYPKTYTYTARRPPTSSTALACVSVVSASFFLSASHTPLCMCVCCVCVCVLCLCYTYSSMTRVTLVCLWGTCNACVGKLSWLNQPSVCLLLL